MSLILFFGATTLVVITGFTLVGLTLHHHWKQGKIKAAQGKKA